MKYFIPVMAKPHTPPLNLMKTKPTFKIPHGPSITQKKEIICGYTVQPYVYKVVSPLEAEMIIKVSNINIKCNNCFF